MIALCPNPYRDAGLIRTDECRALLAAAGYETCVCPVFTESDWQAPENMTICSLREVLPELTHVVVTGPFLRWYANWMEPRSRFSG